MRVKFLKLLSLGNYILSRTGFIRRKSQSKLGISFPPLFCMCESSEKSRNLVHQIKVVRTKLSKIQPALKLAFIYQTKRCFAFLPHPFVEQTPIHWLSASGKLLLTLVKENYSQHRNEAKNNYVTF